MSSCLYSCLELERVLLVSIFSKICSVASIYSLAVQKLGINESFNTCFCFQFS
jgi:hypothetical protein